MESKINDTSQQELFNSHNQIDSDDINQEQLQNNNTSVNQDEIKIKLSIHQQNPFEIKKFDEQESDHPEEIYNFQQKDLQNYNLVEEVITQEQKQLSQNDNNENNKVQKKTTELVSIDLDSSNYYWRGQSNKNQTINPPNTVDENQFYSSPDFQENNSKIKNQSVYRQSIMNSQKNNGCYYVEQKRFNQINTMTNNNKSMFKASKYLDDRSSVRSESQYQKNTLIVPKTPQNNNLGKTMIFSNMQKGKELKVKKHDSVQLRRKKNPDELILLSVKVQQLAKAMQESLESINFKKMRPKDFQFIGDKAYYQQESSNKIIEIGNDLSIYLQKIKVFEPSNIIIQAWKFCVMLGIIVQLVLIPLQLSFSVKIENQFHIILLHYLPLSIFLADIICCLNTAYYHQGALITDRKKIQNNYFITEFPVDCLTTLSLVIMQTELGQFVPALTLVFLFRINQASSLGTSIAEQFQIIQKYGTQYTLFKLLFMVCLLAHYFGCGFHWLGQYGIRQGFSDTWLQVNEIESAQWGVRYLDSLYFAFITASTVGFGDISPVTSQEKIYIITFTLIACAQFAYVVNIIGSIFQQIAEKEQEFKQRQYDIINYMNSRSIEKHQQIKVLKYLDYLNTKKDQGSEKGELILDLLPRELKEEIQSTFFTKVIQQTKIFRLNFSNEALHELSLKMREIVFAPDEIIYSQGTSDDNIYIIREGEVELYIEKEEKQHILCRLTNNQYFGLAEFISQKPREVSVRSIGITNAVYVSHEDFSKSMQNYSIDFEKFCMMKDQANFNKKSLGQQCISCNSYHHQLYTCPLIFFNRKKYQIIGRGNYTLEQQRLRYNRGNNTVRFNSLSDNYAIKYSGRYKILEHNELIDALEIEELDLMEGSDKQLCWDIQCDMEDFSDGFIKAFESYCSSDSDDCIDNHKKIINIQNGQNKQNNYQQSVSGLKNIEDVSDQKTDTYQSMRSRKLSNESQQIGQTPQNRPKVPSSFGFDELIFQKDNPQQQNNKRRTLQKQISIIHAKKDISEQIKHNRFSRTSKLGQLAQSAQRLSKNLKRESYEKINQYQQPIFQKNAPSFTEISSNQLLNMNNQLPNNNQDVSNPQQLIQQQLLQMIVKENQTMQQLNKKKDKQKKHKERAIQDQIFQEQFYGKIDKSPHFYFYDMNSQANFVTYFPFNNQQPVLQKCQRYFSELAGNFYSDMKNCKSTQNIKMSNQKSTIFKQYKNTIKI